MHLLMKMDSLLIRKLRNIYKAIKMDLYYPDIVLRQLTPEAYILLTQLVQRSLKLKSNI